MIAKIIILLVLSPTLFAAKTFVYCSEASPNAFNPQITTDGTSSNASSQTIYDNLVAFKHGTTEIIPSLAESWTKSKDGKKFTFKLRKNVPFHKTKYFTPSRNLNADDVLFSFKRQNDKKHSYHKVNGGNYDYWNAMNMPKIIKSIKKLDDHTVEINLTEPNAPFLANLAMPFAVILSAEYANQLEKKNKKGELDHKPIGTGPFVFKSYKKDALVRFNANAKYFGGKPKIDRLVFSITPDPSVRYQKLKTGECHFVIYPAPHDLKAMEKHPKIKLAKLEGMNVGYLAMNVQRKPLDNKLVREAIHYALNRDSYIDAIYQGHAVVAKNPIPPTIWSYRTKSQKIAHNIKKAKDLMKKAGFANGYPKELTLWTLPVSRPYNPNGKKMGEMMQADLAKIGIKVKLVTYEWGTYLKKSREGIHDFIQLGWTGDNGDPDNFLDYLLSCHSIKSGQNLARWCNNQFSNLTGKAKKILDTKQRTKLYGNAQKVFKQDLPWVPIAHSINYRAMAKNVKGYVMDPMGHDNFSKVDL